MDMNLKIQSILEDDFQRVQEDSRYLENISLKKVLDLTELLPAYQKAKDENPELDMDGIFSEAQGIKARFERRKINFKIAKLSLLEEKKITEEEAVEAEIHVLNLEDRGIDISVDKAQSPEKLAELIYQTFSTNATLKSALIQEGAEINVEELEEQGVDSKIIYHLKKTALDQAVISCGFDLPEKYDSLFHDDFVVKDHKLNQQFSEDDRVQGKKVEWFYFNAQKMDRIQFPRFAEFFIPSLGVNAKYLKNEHHENRWSVSAVIGGKNVRVKVPVWWGQVSGIME